MTDKKLRILTVWLLFMPVFFAIDYAVLSKCTPMEIEAEENHVKQSTSFLVSSTQYRLLETRFMQIVEMTSKVAGSTEETEDSEITITEIKPTAIATPTVTPTAVPTVTPTPEPTAVLSRMVDNEMEILYRIVEAELGIGTYQGKVNIAHVILNRVKSEQFPNTIKEVVFQKDGNTYQFSPIKNKSYWEVEVSQDTIDACNQAINEPDCTNGALYFNERSLTSSKNNSWFDTLERLFTDENGVTFYR